MEIPQDTNPVSRRLFDANLDWCEFASQSQCTFLHWQIAEADLPLLQTFFQAQSEYANGVFVVDDAFLSRCKSLSHIVDPC